MFRVCDALEPYALDTTQLHIIEPLETPEGHYLQEIVTGLNYGMLVKSLGECVPKIAHRSNNPVPASVPNSIHEQIFVNERREGLFENPWAFRFCILFFRFSTAMRDH